MLKIAKITGKTTISLFGLVFMCFTALSILSASASDEAFLQAGVEAVGQKQYVKAIKHLTKATSTGSLTAEQTAKAYYYRGVAYNGVNEPARSIADLTNALFFKKISPDLKSKILIARAQAYRAVGLVDRAENDIRASGKGGITIAKVRRPSTLNNGSQNTQNRRNQINFAGATGTENNTDIRPQPRKRQVVRQGWGASVNSNASDNSTTVRRQPARIARVTPRNTTANSNSNSNNQNYRNLFNSRSRTLDNPVRKNTTFRSTDRVPTRTASLRTGGRYRLQLAAVSSENDARAAWSRLVARFSSLLSDQRPDFQRVNLGGDKSVVRIQIGPFSDKLQTLQLCNTFKQQGLDCFLVVR